MAHAETQPVKSVIHDIGYQRYQGARLGRGYAVRSLYQHSMRTVFGIGRGAKAKIFPWLIIGIALAFALIAIAVRTLTDQQLVSYEGYANAMSYPVMMFLAIVAPELVSRDLRDKVLPLYFSRPLSRSDYALTKLGALFSAVLLLLAVPQLLMYIGAVFSRDSDYLSGAWSELKDLWPGLVSAGIYGLVLSGLSLLIASLTSRRAFGAAGVVAVFLLTTPIVGILIAIGGPTLKKLAFLANPMTMVQGVQDWLFGKPANDGSDIGGFGPVYGLSVAALIAVSVALLLARYRKVSS